MLTLLELRKVEDMVIFTESFWLKLAERVWMVANKEFGQ